MEQLPPKSPITMSHNFSHYSFPFQMMPPPPPLTATATTDSAATWVDDFLDFSATRRSHHRRTVSDPIAFVETPATLFHENNNDDNNNDYHNSNSFERLDDEQLNNMFSDDVGLGPYPGSNPSSAIPSTPSSDEHNGSDSMSDEKIKLMSQPNVKNEPGEEDSGNNHQNDKSPLDFNASSDQAIVDPKRIKRILANRQSAQRSRVRKLHYISELERSVTTLQTEVSALSPRVAFLDHQRLLLNVDNSALRQRIAALAQDKIFKDAHQEALKKEIERLRRIYHEQISMKKEMNTDDESPFDNTTTGNKRVPSEE